MTDDQPLTISEYAEATDETAIYPEDDMPEFVSSGQVYAALELADEACEVQGKLKKPIREDDPRYFAGIADELGDVLWPWARCCIEFGLDPEEVAKQNLKKLRDRKDRGALKGEGDDR